MTATAKLTVRSHAPLNSEPVLHKSVSFSQLNVRRSYWCKIGEVGLCSLHYADLEVVVDTRQRL